MALAAYWVFLVPMLQAPDEDCHADYAFTLYSKKKLIQGAEAPLAGCSHPYVKHLFEQTNGQAIKVTAFGKLPAAYGTKEFFQDLDLNTPAEQICLQTKTNPVLMSINPVGYYALLAAWLNLLSCFNNHLTFLFFSARLFSVILLGCGLAFSYLSMRELGLSYLRASLTLMAIAFFPMVTFVGSYIQPDNLSFALVSACFWLSLRWRNKFTDKVPWLLALTMALLLLTKYQFFFAVAIAVIAMIISKCIYLKFSISKIFSILAILLIPSAAFAILQAWISWGCHLPDPDSQHFYWFTNDRVFKDTLNQNASVLISHIFNALLHGFRSMYCAGGQAFTTFWGCFGHLDVPLIIYSPAITPTLQIIISWLTKVIILMTLASLAKILLRLFNIARKGHWQRALYMACSNPIINSYFLFTFFIFSFFVISYPTFAGQGRNWFPLILAIFLAASIFAPSVFNARAIKQQMFFLITFIWLCYSLIGSYAAPGCIYKKYYPKAISTELNIQSLKPAFLDTSDFITWLQYVDRYPSFNIHPKHDLNSLVVPKGKDIWVQGWAADLPTDSLANSVWLCIDQANYYRATYGLQSQDAIEKTKKNKYLFSGFAALIATKDFSKGTHMLTVKIVSRDGHLLYNTKQEIKIVIE